MASLRPLFAIIGPGVALLVLSNCVGREIKPIGASLQVTSVTQITPKATRELPYPAFIPETSGYPELLSATAEPTLSPTPTSTVIPAPTAGPTVMVSYSLESVEDWEGFVNEDYGIRFKYPSGGSVRTWNSEQGSLSGREITLVIGVSEDGSGIVDHYFWVYTNAYHLTLGQDLDDFQKELSDGFGSFYDGPPRGGYPTYTPILEDIQQHLAQIADGGARLQYDWAVARAGFFVIHSDIGILVTFGVDMMTDPSERDVQILQMVLSTLELGKQ